MSGRESNAEHLLEDLGELSREEREQLAALDAQADALSEVRSERQREIEDAVLHDLGLLEPAPRASGVRALRPRVRWLAAAGALAAAASIGLMLARSPGRQADFDVQYSLAAPRSDSELRAADPQPVAARPVYSLGRTLRFVLRPSTSYSGPLGVECYALRRNDRVRFEPELSREPGGGLILLVRTGAGQALDVAPGDWELRFFVAPAAAPPLTETEHSAGGCPADRRCLSLPVELRAP